MPNEFGRSRATRAVPPAVVTTYFPAIAISLFLGCSEGEADIGEFQAATTVANESMAVPAYIAANGDWSQAMPTHSGGFFVVNGPASGPPTDSLLGSHVTTLQNSGTSVLGYVNFSADRTLVQIRADVNQWHTYLPQLNGIFFDNTDRSTEDDLPIFENVLIYTQGLFSFMQNSATVMFNNGTVHQITEKYVDCLDLFNYNGYPTAGIAAQKWVTFEKDEYTYRNFAWSIFYGSDGNWVHNYSPYRFANLLYSTPSDGSTLTGRGSDVYAIASANAHYIYATDEAGPPANTWGRIASNSLWTQEQAAFSQAVGYDGKDFNSEIRAFTSRSQCPAPSP